MALITGVSFLGQSVTQTQRLKEMHQTLGDLQRQITTQKKHETLAGFGADAQRILQLRSEKSQLEAYSGNIDKALTRIDLMSDTMDKVADAVREITDAIRLQPEGAAFDMDDISERAQQLLDFVVDLANLEFDGRFLFAGTDAQNIPYADPNTPATTIQAEVTNWLAGGQTTTQLSNNVTALSGAPLGFSNSISGATNASVRIDTRIEVSYGALADRSGIQDAIRMLTFLANMQKPDPAVDVATIPEFVQAIDYAQQIGRTALNQIENTQTTLISKLDLIKNIKESHEQDINLYNKLIDEEENADTTEAIALMQALSTQITASYQVTRAVSELALVNFI